MANTVQNHECTSRKEDILDLTRGSWDRRLLSRREDWGARG